VQVLLSPPIVVYSPSILPAHVYDAHADCGRMSGVWSVLFIFCLPFVSIILRALATDSFRESVSLHLGKKSEKTTKTSHSRSPIFNLVHWVLTVFLNA
jgi:hypothetical protein